MSVAPAAPTGKPWIARVAKILPFALPVLLLLPDYDYVPLFDGRYYADCITAMATHPSADKLICAGHPTHAYILFTSALIAIAPYRPALLLLAHLVILAGGVWGFRGVLEALYPDPERGLERAALTALFAVQPVMLSAVLQPEPGLATTAAALLMLEAMLSRRFVRAGLFGVVIIFTKEIGALIFGALVLAYALVFITRPEGPWRQKLKALLQLWPLATPVVVFVARFAYVALVSHGPALVTPESGAASAFDIAGEFLSLRLLDRTFLSYSAAVFVLEFQWVLALAILAWVAVRAGRWAVSAPPLESDPERRRNGTFVLLSFGLVLWLTTRYHTYSNARYVLPNYPFALLAAYAAVRELRLGLRTRAALAALVFVGWLASARATVDPVSKWVYGTFQFGTRTMLDMNSITGFPLDRYYGGYGRDELVYNLEFEKIAGLQGQILAYLKKLPPETVLVDQTTNWYLWDNVDIDDVHRTLDTGRPRSNTEIVTFLRQTTPRNPYFVLYPNFSPVQSQVLNALRNFYEITATQTIDNDGYSAEVFSLSLDVDRFRAWFSVHPTLGLPGRPQFCN